MALRDMRGAPPRRFHPELTVAAVVEREGAYLMVEERVAGRLVLNQPAGHVEPGEMLAAAVVREAWRKLPGISYRRP